MKTKILQNTLFRFGLTFALAITAHAQNLYVTVNGPIADFTHGSISEYTPGGAQTAFASGLDRPRGIAFDSSGNLFVGLNVLTPSGNTHGKVLEFNPQNKPNALGNAAHDGFEGVVTDSAGNVFVMGLDTIYKFAPDGTRTIFGTLGSNPQGFGLAFDSAGNLFAADANNATIFKYTPDGTRTVFAGPSAFAATQAPIGLAFDSAGNLFVSTEGDPGNDAILEFTPGSVESTFATGLTNPRGLAFDGSGNLFVAETHAGGDILEFTPAGVGTVFASGIARPEFLAFGPAR
jgi:glucose/arabinose dehydrogenase